MEKKENKNLINNFNAGNSRTGTHLSDEEIIDYQYGNTPSPEIERQAQNHFIECRRCANLLLELSGFAESVTQVSALNAENTDVQWARFESKRLAESKSANQIAATRLKPDSESRSNFFGFLSFNFATASAFGVLAILVFGAAFLLLRNADVNESSIALNTPLSQIESAASERGETVENKNTSQNITSDENSNRRSSGRAGQNSSLPSRSNQKNEPKNEIINRSMPVQETNKTTAPQDELALNKVDFELYPNEVLRGADETRKIRVKQDIAGQIRLKLNAPEAKKLSAFSLEITDSQNKAVLTLPVLPDKRGNFYIIIPAKKLPADIYSLRIYAEENNARKLFTEYGFELEYN